MSRWVDETGRIAAISYPGNVPNPSVRVTLECAEGSLLLVFQSRTNVAALDIDQQLHVCGNVVQREEERLLYNPIYEIVDNPRLA